MEEKGFGIVMDSPTTLPQSMKSPLVPSRSRNYHGQDQGKPPTSDFLMKTPEQLVSYIGERGSLGLVELPSRFSIDEFGSEIAEIGLDGAESLSPIAVAGVLSPEVTPHDQVCTTTRDEFRHVSSPSKQESVENPPKGKLPSDKDPLDDVATFPTHVNKEHKTEVSPSISNSSLRAGEESHLRSVSKSGEESRVQSDDIEAAQTLAGVSSRVFIEQLRGAAFRRKIDLARSRDSLVAKEKEHREAHVASRLAEVVTQGDKSETKIQHEPRHSLKVLHVPSDVRGTGAAGIPIIQKRPSTVPVSPVLGRRRQTHHGVSAKVSEQTVQEAPTTAFKARPFPRTAYSEVKAGIHGVHMVQKKPPTIPVSPKLGLRKPLAEKEKNTESLKEEKDRMMFKARPLPTMSGIYWDSGSVGVAKVPKRQVTIPVSPLLGARRLTSEAELGNGPKSDTSALIGIEFIKSPSNGNVQPTVSPQPAVTPQQHHSTPREFIPHSTLRAEKRAIFDAARREHELEREEEQSRKLKGQVRVLQKELNVLRDQI